MILKYILPQYIDKELNLSDDERIYYSVPVDIDEDGNWTDNSYVVVTTKKIYIFRGEKKTVYEIKDIKSVSAEPGV